MITRKAHDAGLKKNAKNFEKSWQNIWKCQKNFVPLQSIREMLCERGLRLGKASKLDFSLALHHPCTSHEIKSGRRRADVDRRKVI